eukprot:CAMPEP_0196652314 /NCGR_PEP_ID=MMETSP1086-20130531/1555_1 /TAXON_ID=77921 /ORGANISM="Cyanoptyche  gloeocystis , Strain SAG4.97" /LENGTH=94 /DNA_ID=CAMNT_0041982783 /DNA_START=240 /DNA_END=524 /DNA_ORIENTATION=-
MNRKTALPLKTPIPQRQSRHERHLACFNAAANPEQGFSRSNDTKLQYPSLDLQNASATHRFTVHMYTLSNILILCPPSSSLQSSRSSKAANGQS